jgi:hypothetical protein
MLEIGYITLTLLMSVLIVFLYSKHLNSNKQKTKFNKTKNMVILMSGLGLWFLYLYYLSVNKVLQNLELPPRFFSLLLAPFFIFCIVFYILNRNNKTIQSIPLKWTILYQTFRIVVETLILFTFMENILPRSATFEGYNFDILIGLSAPIVYYIYLRTKSKKLLYAWNILGILMILFVGFIVATSTYKPETWGGTTPLVSLDFFVMPYLLLAGFLAPSGIFIHVVNLIQLRDN